MGKMIEKKLKLVCIDAFHNVVFLFYFVFPLIFLYWDLVDISFSIKTACQELEPHHHEFTLYF